VRLVQKLLLGGISMPIVYFVALFGAGAVYPDFSHFSQTASELGADGAPYRWAWAFNVALILVGALGIAAAIGLFIGCRQLGIGVFLLVLTSIGIGLAMINMLMSGLFPLPHPWHSNLLLVLAGVFVPLFGALVMQKALDKGASMILWLSFVVAVIFTAPLLGFGGCVTEGNLGLWLRLWAVALLFPIGYLCWSIRGKLLTSVIQDNHGR